MPLYLKCIKHTSTCPYFTDGKLYKVTETYRDTATVVNDWRQYSTVTVGKPSAHLDHVGWFEIAVIPVGIPHAYQHVEHGVKR